MLTEAGICERRQAEEHLASCGAAPRRADVRAGGLRVCVCVCVFVVCVCMCVCVCVCVCVYVLQELI